MHLRNSWFKGERSYFLVLLLAGIMSGCGGSKRMATTGTASEAVAVPESNSLEQICLSSDTVSSVLISRAHTEYLIDDDRYEAEISIYAIRDSLVYLSAVNSGFEILRALVEPDSIRVIDRVNRVVYQTAVKKRLGHQNPLNYNDIQNLVSTHFLCDDLAKSMDQDPGQLVFHFDEAHLVKKIVLDKASVSLSRFEFFHDQTSKYFMGEKSEKGFNLFTNFMMGELEIRASGGEISYNVEIPVKMNFNSRRYSKVNL